MENKEIVTTLANELKKIDDIPNLTNEEKEILKKEKIQEFLKNLPKSNF